MAAVWPSYVTPLLRLPAFQTYPLSPFPGEGGTCHKLKTILF